MLHKTSKNEKTNKLKPLVLHKANCIVCNAKIQLTTNSDKEDVICYECYQAMWGKRHFQSKIALTKAAGY